MNSALADTFYIIGIVCMSLYTILLVLIVIILFYIWRKFVDIQTKIEEKLNDITNFIKHPKETASDLGTAAVSSAFDKLADIVRGNVKKNKSS